MSTSGIASSGKHPYAFEHDQSTKRGRDQKSKSIKSKSGSDDVTIQAKQAQKVNLVWSLITIAVCSTFIYLGSEVINPSWGQDFLITIGSLGILAAVFKIVEWGKWGKAGLENVEFIDRENSPGSSNLVENTVFVIQLIFDFAVLALMSTLIYLGTEINTPSWAGAFIIAAGSIKALEALVAPCAFCYGWKKKFTVLVH